ncbi:MAG: hypothetical protein J5563_02235 [Clostridia bacterium]|nr:hypothetical protein [Clostridia bacterium]
MNFKQFDWMENEYFVYEAELDFAVSDRQRAFLHFGSIDYRYRITVGGRLFADGEGIFSPVYLDVSSFSGQKTIVQVIVFPVPSHKGEKPGRSEARYSCKPPVSYGWDWHPRLIPSGIIGISELIIADEADPLSMDLSYRLSDDYKKALVSISAESFSENGTCTLTVTDPDGTEIYRNNIRYGGGGTIIVIESPSLWYPRTYGEQPLYTFTVISPESGSLISRKLGFRRSELVRNFRDAERFENGFPKTSLPAPATLKINGTKVFAKGSNWVSAEIFPSLITDRRVEELLKMAYEANINILRIWGGQYICSEHFYDLCDRYGIMVWQEFMLSCNDYPDDEQYLKVLEKEASSIIRRLRSHPSVVMWSGGNELFNSWSGMTCQSHPLRLLDKLCYELDPDTPFNMTSPVQGMGHGTYVKCTADRSGETVEFLQLLKKTDFTTYTEFGCNGGAKPEYIKKYIMDDRNYFDCRPENEVWRAHHAFGAWGESRWLGREEVEFFFGSYSGVDDLMEKSLYLQSMTYKAMFEEMRRRWPECSMAVNWDFNEPWPCAAGNSLINWPCVPKEAYYSVKEALRPTLLSLCFDKNRWKAGEEFTGTVWMLNDSPDSIPETECEAIVRYGATEISLGKVKTPECSARSNRAGDGFSFVVPADITERFTVCLKCAEHGEYNSEYHFVCRSD